MHPVYEGNEPYIFISYAHRNSAQVEPLIRVLQERGCRVWYDSGLSGGEKWTNTIADHVCRCGCFLLFLSPEYAVSDYCMQEIHFALKQKRPILPVYLDDVALDPGLDMQLSPIHALFFDRKSGPDDIAEAILKAPVLQSCRQAESIVPKALPESVNLPETKPGKKSGHWLKKVWVITLIAVVALVAILAVVFIGMAGNYFQMPLNTGRKATLMPNYCMFVDQEPDEAAFNTNVAKKDIGTITFLDTLDDAPIHAADASSAQNGLVKAWTVENGSLYDLYIAAEGGVYAPENSSFLFVGMTNVTSIDFGDYFFTKQAYDMDYMFANCERLEEVDLSGFDTSNVAEMQCMFARCISLEELDVSSFDTSQVINMKYMFACCERLKELDLKNFDTSRVLDMNGMFGTCKMLQKLDVSSFNTASVTDMTDMFVDCNYLSELDVSRFDTGSVVDFTRMFSRCFYLRSLDLSSFDTSRAENMCYMFFGCQKLTELDISSFDTSNVTDMQYMFYETGCAGDLDLSHFDFSKVTSRENFMMAEQMVNGVPWQELFS